MRDRSCHPCLRTLLPRGGEKICIIDQDTFQTWSNVVHFAPSPDHFACSRKKAIRFLCMPFATILLILQPFWLHIFLSHIYIFFLHQSILFFLFLFPFSFSHLSPPLPFFSVFLMLAHRSNHLFTYSFIYPPIFISSRTLGNSFGNSANHCFRSLFFFSICCRFYLLSIILVTMLNF